MNPESSSIWSDDHLVDSIFNDLINELDDEGNNNNDNQKKFNKYILQFLNKFQSFIARSQSAYFEIDIKDLDFDTLINIESRLQFCKTVEEKYVSIDGIMTEVIAKIAKHCELLLISDYTKHGQEVADLVRIKRAISQIQKLVSFKWCLICEGSNYKTAIADLSLASLVGYNPHTSSVIESPNTLVPLSTSPSSPSSSSISSDNSSATIIDKQDSIDCNHDQVKSVNNIITSKNEASSVYGFTDIIKEMSKEPEEQMIISISDCLRRNNGQVRASGTITSLSRIYKMIKSAEIVCIDCEYHYTKIFTPPVNLIPSQYKRCNDCKVSMEIKNCQYLNAVNIELHDSDKFSDTERLTCILFDDNTRDVLIGEKVIIEGSIHVCQANKKSYPYLFATSIKYENKKSRELTPMDIEAIKRFTKIKGSKIIDCLVDMYAKPVIGLEIVKKGLLLSSTSTSNESNSINFKGSLERDRIHVLLVGDPGIAKSRLIKEAVKAVPNSRYESSQHSSAKSLTAIVSKENEDLVLRLGPIPLSRNSICALNEIGRMTPEDQAYLLDIMEEGEFTINKYGLNSKIRSDTVIIATANPIESSWNADKNNSNGSNNSVHDTKIDISKIPLLRPVLDRFDLIYILKDIREEQVLRDYVSKKMEANSKRIPDYNSYLEKHLIYAKTFNPVLNDEAKYLINQFYVKLASSNSSSLGSKRTLDTLVRLAKAVSRLRLKSVTDVEDAKDALDFYNTVSFQYMDNVTSIPNDPRDVALIEFIDILKNSSYPYTLEELAKTACERNEYVKSYLMSSPKHKLKLEYNRKLRCIYDILVDNPNIQLINTKPIVLQWNPLKLENVSDTSDISDTNNPTYKLNDSTKSEMRTSSISTLESAKSSMSYTSDRSDNNEDKKEQSYSQTEGINKKALTGSSNASIIVMAQSHEYEYEYECYRCDFKTNYKEQYEQHYVIRHPGKPAFPNTASIIEDGLTPQGKPWE